MIYRNLVFLFCSNLVLFINPSVLAQGKQDISSGSIEYAYRMKAVGVEEKYNLEFNRYECVYRHYQEEHTIISPQGYEMTSPRKFYDWYIDLSKKQVTEREKQKDGKMIFATFDAIIIDWEIQEETKVILGYTVQKAIAKRHHFVKGKGNIEYGDAIAWFAADLPISSGPERFWGLPGLILEISFTKFIGTYTAEKITFKPVVNLKPNQGTQVSKEVLYKNKPWLGEARSLMNNN